MAITQGTWGIGGWKLPDIGLTETIQSLRGGINKQNTTFTNPAQVQSWRQEAPMASVQGLYAPKATLAYQYPAPTNIPPSGGGNPGLPSSPINTGNNATGNITGAVDEYANWIEQDYQNAMGSLVGQEQGLRGQAELATQQIGTEFAQTQAQLGQEQATQQAGVQSQLQTGETGAKTALQQARDLFAQTQQRNIAMTSGLGISSSSVSEALAEMLGRDTMRRISSITGSLQEIRQNATKELARINNYYQGQITNLQQAKSIEIGKIQNSLLAGINQINTARKQAAVDKTRSRWELINNAKSAVDYINQQIDAFKTSLSNWASGKSSALAQIAANPEYIAAQKKQTENITANYAPTGWEYVPNVNAYGYITGYTLRKKETDNNTGIVGNIDYTSPNAWKVNP